jgi:hypothetical protein
MVKIYSLFCSITIALLLSPNTGFSQTLEFGILSSFEAYTGAGAITNTGEFNGDAGSNDGIISGTGFGDDFSGTTYEDDSVTVQARVDLLRVYIHLSDVFVDFPGSHAAAFGFGETIFPGVYSIPGAGSVGGAITLDGQGDPEAFFILKYDGALTVAVGSEIILTGGTRAANVFWIAEGAISIGADAVLAGTFFAHPGAVSLGTNCTLDGRMFSSEGALTLAAGGVAGIPEGDSNIPIKCIGFCAPNPQVDVLGSLNQYALFTSYGAVANAATSGIVGNIGSNGGALSGFGTSTHAGFFNIPSVTTAQAVEDLESAYNQLAELTNTELGHLPAFGSGETVFHGVYYTGGAGSLAGTITLDGQGDPDAIFVFKFNGAFSVAAQSKVILTNGASRCNVFWISEGATDIGTFSYMKGTVIAHAGAASMAANGNLEGRLLSTAGAIGFSTGVVYNDALCFEPIIVTGANETECIEDFPTLTATATATSTNQFMVWYDAAVGGNIVEDPTLVGVGSVTFYAAAYNGAYYSATRGASTLTITDCSIVPILTAVDDSYSPIQIEDEATIVGDVTENDTLNGILVTVDNTVVTPITTGPLSIDSNGELTLDANTLSGTYSITYQLCQYGSNITNCDFATVTVEVAIIDAVDDTTEPVNGLTGGATTSLTLNDTLSEDPVVIGTESGNVTLEGLDIPVGFTLNLDGTVTVPPNTPAGEYLIEYQICEVGNLDNCDSATSTIVVAAPTITALDDNTEPVNGSTGGTTITSLTSNDTLNGVPVIVGTESGNVILSGFVIPTGFTLNANGTVTVPMNTPVGVYSIVYQICEVDNPGNCDMATSSIFVSAPTIIAVEDITDPIDGLTGGTTTSLTTNDTLDGLPVIIGTDPGNVILTGLEVPTGFTLNPNGTVTIDPNTPAGEYSITYQICEVINLGNCDSVTSTILVAAPVIEAFEDLIEPINGTTGGTTTSLTSNDTLNGDPVVLGTNPGNVVLTGLDLPTGFTLNPDGTVTIAPNTPAGEYSVEYQICEVTNPTNCDSVTSLITVAESEIDAVTETTPEINGNTGGTTLPLTSNDTLNGDPVVIGTDPGNVTMTTAGLLPAGITVDTATGIVTVAPNTVSGEYNLEYTICEITNPANCDTVTSIINVKAAEIDAVTETTPEINGNTGGTTSPLTSNDTLSGLPVVIGTDPGDVKMTIIGSLPEGITVDTDSGIVTVAPNTPVGDYSIEYVICEITNPTNCDSVTSTITVIAADIDAVADTLDPVNGLTGGTTTSLTANDTLNGNPVVIGTEPGNVILTGLEVPTGFTLNPDGTVTIDPNTPAGEYSVEYQICEVDNLDNCDSVTSTIVVDPPVLVADEDTPDPIDGLTGGTTTPLTSNDTINGDPVVIGTEPGNVILTGLDVPTGFTLNPDGTVTIDPNTPAGDYSITYQICEVTNPTNCDSVTSTIVVAVPEIEAVADVAGPIIGLTGGTTASLTLNDTLNGDPVVIGTDPGNVTMTTGVLPEGITVDITTGIVTVAPNTPAGNYPISYTICELDNPTNCDTVIATILVSAPIIDANEDNTPDINGTAGGDTAPLTSNDTLNGDPVVIGTEPGNVTLTGLDVPAGFTLNPDGTVSVDPNTPDGDYSVEYQICEVTNPANCNSVTSTITVINLLPDFTPTIDIDALSFPTEGSTQDFVVNISEIASAPSVGEVVLVISKGGAFNVSYDDAASNANVNGGVPVNNADWIKTENAIFIIMTLKPNVIIDANAFSTLGFTVTRNPDVAPQTSQPLTVTIVNGSGLDGQSSNNTYNTVVIAQ